MPAGHGQLHRPRREDDRRPAAGLGPVWTRFGARRRRLRPGPRRPAAAAGADGRLDAPAWFGRRGRLRLEIGSGMGETTAALAAAEPDADHVAVEVYPPGLAQLLMRARGGRG